MESTTAGAPGKILSPFITIWYQPRPTIRRILDTDPQRYVLVLAAINGVLRTLGRASNRSYGDTIPFPIILLIALIAGSIGGVITMYMMGALYRWTGSWLGGKANSMETRAAFAWSLVPGFVTVPLWVLELIIFGEEMFTTATPRLDANPLLVILVLGIALIEIAFGIWAVFLMIKCVAEAHQFSAWKGLATLLLGILVIAVPIFIIVIIQQMFYFGP